MSRQKDGKLTFVPTMNIDFFWMYRLPIIIIIMWTFCCCLNGAFVSISMCRLLAVLQCPAVLLCVAVFGCLRAVRGYLRECCHQNGEINRSPNPVTKSKLKFLFLRETSLFGIQRC